MTQPLIKICGITSVEDARMALDMGADFLGIILYEHSPRAVPLSQVEDLLDAIPQGKRVLVDVSTPTDVLGSYRDLPFDFYQMHFDLDVAIATVAAWSGLIGRDRLWLAPRIPQGEQSFPQIIMEFADTLLVDSYSKEAYGGTGKAGNWQSFLDWTTLYQHKRWILAGGLSPLNIFKALEATDAPMIDVNSGVESSPGVKNPQLVAALMEQVQLWRQQRAAHG